MSTADLRAWVLRAIPAGPTRALALELVDAYASARSGQYGQAARSLEAVILSLAVVQVNPETRYTVDGHPGIAWRYDGPETVPDEDTEWTGLEVETGRVVMVMVGDDRRWSIDPDDCSPLEDSEFCSSCGQVGCGWGGAE